MRTLQRRLARVRAQLEASTTPPVACRDAVDLWRRIMGGEPDPWQADVLRSQRPRLLLNCCRQSGKSSVSAVLGLYVALYQAPALVLLVSASLRQAQELGKKLFDGYRALGKPVSAEAENRLSLELANGSRVVCLPSREATVRGFSGVRLLIVDEASRVDDGLYHAVRPMLAVSGGRLLGLSTPYGRRGWFYAAWQSNEFHRYRVTAHECPRIHAAFLAEEQRVLPPYIFAQEYLCEFVENELQVFHMDDVLAAIAPDEALTFPGLSFDAWRHART